MNPHSPSRTAALLAILAAASLVLPSPRAWAQTPEVSEADLAAGKELYEQGKQAFAEDRFADAARLFDQAWDKTRRTKYLWSASQAHRQQYEVGHDLGELRTARLQCEQFVAATDNALERANAMRELPALDEELKRAEAGVAAASAATAITPPAPASAVEAPKRSRWWVWALVGTGAALVVGGAAVGTAVALGGGPSVPMTNGGNFRVMP